MRTVQVDLRSDADQAAADRLQVAIADRLVEVGLKDLRSLARVARVSIETLRSIRSGKRKSKQATERKIELALQWPAGRLAAIRSGTYVATEGDPPMIATETPDTKIHEIAGRLAALTPDERVRVNVLADWVVAEQQRQRQAAWQPPAEPPTRITRTDERRTPRKSGVTSVE